LTIESLTQGKSIEEGDTYLKSYLESIVQQGISSSRLILMGFSQGGALALYTGLRWNRPLAGIGGLSTYLPLLPTQLQKEKKQAATLPILLAHGWMDAVVPYALGQQALTQLQAQGYAPTWHPYPMDHSVCLTELEEIGKWIRQILEL